MISILNRFEFSFLKYDDFVFSEISKNSKIKFKIEYKDTYILATSKTACLTVNSLNFNLSNSLLAACLALPTAVAEYPYVSF